MNRNIKYKHIALIIGMLALLTLAGCKKDDKRIDEIKLTLSESDISLKVGEKSSIEIMTGIAPFSEQKGESQDIVSVEIKKYIIHITGLKEGKTQLTIVDKNGSSAKISITVEAIKINSVGIFPKKKGDAEYFKMTASADKKAGRWLFESVAKPYEKRVFIPFIKFENEINSIIEEEIKIQGLTIDNLTYSELKTEKIKGKVVLFNEKLVVIETDKFFVGFPRK